MAKKKTAGKGKKFCPGCGKIIAARSGSHDCGWVKEVQVTKPKPVKKTGTVDPKVALALWLQAKTYASEFETMDNAKEVLEMAVSLANACGGVAEAKQWLDTMEGEA
jgi:hypothetical protein